MVCVCARARCFVCSPRCFANCRPQAHDTAVAIANLAVRFGMSALPNCVPTLISLAELGTEQTQELTGTTIAGLSTESTKLENGSVSALLSLLEEHDGNNKSSMGAVEPIERAAGLGSVRSEAPSVKLEQRDELATWTLRATFEADFPREAVRVPELDCSPDENVAGANEEKISDWTDRVHSFGHFRDVIRTPCQKVHVGEYHSCSERVEAERKAYGVDVERYCKASDAVAAVRAENPWRADKERQEELDEERSSRLGVKTGLVPCSSLSEL